MLVVRLVAAAAAAAALLLAPRSAATQTLPPAPRDVLGFEVGADRTLADWGQITGYFTRLANASPRVRVDTLGPSTNGLPFIVAVISSPANLERLPQILADQRLLADPRQLSDEDEARLVRTQPSILFISCNIHATEIAASQMAMELAWRLATNDTLQRWLEHTIVLLAPSMNPDGQQMITEWYRQGVGTPWEGGPLPWLYHPYVGHDNNRDWFMLTQRETRLVTDYLYGRWFPQVFYDVHQMGAEGARLFVPPMVDPVNPNLDPLLVRAMGHIGSEMALALEERGKSGVANSVIYDLWWHGGARSTPTRHNIVGVITEAASVRIATPIVQDTSRMRGHARGLPRYERRVNFPNPWPGGIWTLRDIVEYELIASEALIRLMAEQREQYVRNFVNVGRRALEAGQFEPPHAWVIPAAQRDHGATRQMVDVLLGGYVEVDRATAPFVADGREYAAGSYIVRAEQPYRAHAKDLLERQVFPRMEQYPGGPPERPYDVAGWTLPLQMGVDVDEILEEFDAVTVRAIRDTTSCAEWRRQRALTPQNTAHYRCLARHPRVGLYRPWTSNMDEGWTRWVLETYNWPYVTLTDSAMRAGGLRPRFDVIVIPDMSPAQMRDGMSEQAVPPPYAGGMGEEGLAELRRFVTDGGRLVLVDAASALGPSLFGVDVEVVGPGGGAGRRDAVGGDALYAPGSILRVQVDTVHSIGRGMRHDAAAYFTNSHAFDVHDGSRARVVAWYPANPDDILLSGFLQGPQHLAGRAAVLDVPFGTRGGRVVMFGFRPLYRAQSVGTFKMFFNALLP